jgi:hypothetical protein
MELASWLVGWLIGWLVGWVRWLVGWLLACMLALLAGCLVSQSVRLTTFMSTCNSSTTMGWILKRFNAEEFCEKLSNHIIFYLD